MMQKISDSQSARFVKGRLLLAMQTLFLTLIATTGICADKNRADFFRNHVEPLLVRRCLKCHGSERKGKLDLRTRATALAGGESGAAIKPDQPDESLLYEYILSEKMPPTNPLSADEIAVFKRWIAQGAYFPNQPLDLFAATTEERAGYDWWSLMPLSHAAPPLLDKMPDAWKENAIDRFIYARLAKNGLRASLPATPRQLIRRVTYDLIGLPPTPQELNAFLAACRDETSKERRVGDRAYERLIDRLLMSKHYGEQWGRHWLDVIRFGESNGFERNVIHKTVWPFRDYVIRSINEDKPFDRFIVEHLAGDVVGADDPQVAVGTSFLVCGPYDNVGNQDAAAAAQIRANTIDEMIRATSEAFLGLTVGCSRCHDHKFDPISQRDYYSLYSTFAGVQHGERTLRTKESGRRRLELENVEKAISAVEVKLRTIVPQFGRPVRPKINSLPITPVQAKFVRFTILATNSGEPCIDELEVYSAVGDNAASQNIALASAGGKATSSGNYLGNSKHKLEHINDGEVGNSRSWISDKTGTGWVQIEFAKQQMINRIVWGRDREGKYSDRLATVYKIEVALERGEWHVVAASMANLPLAAEHAAASSEILKRLPAKLAKQAQTLFAQYTKLGSEAARLRDAPLPPTWWVGTFQQNDGPFHVFLGGSPQHLGGQVQPMSMATLARTTRGYKLKSDSPESERRLALANWIVATDNPLPARVLVNRLWHYHFGTGIVNTPSDFGYMGGRPSHPQLLDWLALQLKKCDWRLKPIHKQIVLSQAYRQASTYRPDAAKADADSRLLWRYPPRRLAGEEIRDAILAITGQLDKRMGGPGFRLFRYVQDNVATYHPLDKHGPETYRRCVYHHKARAMQIDLLTEFDTPDCAFSTPRRASTTSPLQALTLMNHSFTIDMARAFAVRLERESKTPSSRDEQVRRAFVLAYSREPTKGESTVCVKFIEENGIRAFCRVLLNSNELIYLK
jgi:hypothetical protein